MTRSRVMFVASQLAASASLDAHQPYSLILVEYHHTYQHILLDSNLTSSCTTVMGALEDLLAQEKTLASQIQAAEDSLSEVRVHIAELKSVNRGAGTYNLPVKHFLLFSKQACPRRSILGKEIVYHGGITPRTTRYELLVSSVSCRWRNIALQTPRLWTILVIDVL